VSDLYYCRGCDHVFDPRSGRVARLEQVEELFA
jgi:rubredoxin